MQETWMSRAIALARRGEGLVEPNPMVGCLIVRDGRVIGEGFHQQFGGPHAELNAITAAEAKVLAYRRDLAEKCGVRIVSTDDTTRLAGATAFVTLEPCCHHGKTPPCSNALIDAGIARVVVAMPDPFPQVDGGGLQQLKNAGIKVEVGLLRDEAEALNAPYLKRVRTGLPWVIAKWAMTIDGRIATATGESQWITSTASREETHRLRSRVDAVCVGMGTVEADDPQLIARLPDSRPSLRHATRVVFCRHRVPSTTSKLVQSACQIPLLLVLGSAIHSGQCQPLTDLGATVLATETDDPTEMVRVALLALSAQGMTNVMVEGGGELLASFLATDQIDEVHVYIGPKIFAGQDAKGPISGEGIRGIANVPSWELQRVDRFDSDWRAVYRKPN